MAGELGSHAWAGPASPPRQLGEIMTKQLRMMIASLAFPAFHNLFRNLQRYCRPPRTSTHPCKPFNRRTCAKVCFPPIRPTSLFVAGKMLTCDTNCFSPLKSCENANAEPASCAYVYKINMSSGPEGAETGFSTDPTAHLSALNL